jgi:hypothetical protein
VRAVVTFKSSAFNTTERKPYFLNDCCFGDDVARWLIARLRGAGVETDREPNQEDFGWYFGFRTVDGSFTVVLSFRPDGDTGDWIATIERDCGLVASVFGGRSRGIALSAVTSMDVVMQKAPELERVRWHKLTDFRRGNESDGTPDPTAA